MQNRICPDSCKKIPHFLKLLFFSTQVNSQQNSVRFSKHAVMVQSIDKGTTQIPKHLSASLENRPKRNLLAFIFHPSRQKCMWQRELFFAEGWARSCKYQRKTCSKSSFLLQHSKNCCPFIFKINIYQILLHVCISGPTKIFVYLTTSRISDKFFNRMGVGGARHRICRTQFNRSYVKERKKCFALYVTLWSKGFNLRSPKPSPSVSASVDAIIEESITNPSIVKFNLPSFSCAYTSPL